MNMNTVFLVFNHKENQGYGKVEAIFEKLKDAYSYIEKQHFNNPEDCHYAVEAFMVQ